MNDKLNGWEKAALFTTGAGGAYNILLYQLGYTLADAAPGNWWLFGSRVLFALVSFVGFDLTLVVTVRAMREGRRSVWAWLTVAAAALAAAGIALDVSEVLPAPVLHAAPVLVLAAFMLHLAQPRAPEARGTRGRARLVRALVAALRGSRAEARSYQGAAAQAQERAARAEAQAAHAARDAEAARAQLADAPAQVEGLDPRTVALWLAQADVSGREIARRLGVGESTVRGWLRPTRASAAD